MTGADSPVIADSSTEAMPSITSPSLGIRSPASTSTMSPCFSCGRGHRLEARRRSATASRLAIVSVRALRSVAACALPRPSATASAKLANSTVIHSQRMIWKVKPRWSAAGDQLAHEDDRGERRDDLDDEHHRVPDQHPRIELDERLPDRRHEDRRVQHRGLRAAHVVPISMAMISCLCRRGCRRASRNARRPARGRRRGRRSGRR